MFNRRSKDDSIQRTEGGDPHYTHHLHAFVLCDFSFVAMLAEDATHDGHLQRPDGSAYGDSEPCGKDASEREQHAGDADPNE